MSKICCTNAVSNQIGAQAAKLVPHERSHLRKNGFHQPRSPALVDRQPGSRIAMLVLIGSFLQIARLESLHDICEGKLPLSIGPIRSRGFERTGARLPLRKMRAHKRSSRGHGCLFQRRAGHFGSKPSTALVPLFVSSRQGLLFGVWRKRLLARFGEWNDLCDAGHG